VIHIGLILAVLVDATLRLALPVDSVWMPNVPLVTAIYIGLSARRSAQLGYAVVLGAYLDCFSVCPLGHFAFLLGAAAYLAWKIRRYIPSDSVSARIVACFVCGVAFALLGLVLAAAGGSGAGNGAGLSRSLLSAAISAASSPLIVALWNRSRLFRTAFRGRSYYELTG